MRRALALVLLVGCKKETAAAVDAGTTTVASAPAASASAAPKAVKDQTCSIAPAVLVSEGRGGYSQTIAASKTGIIASWLEQRSGNGPDGWKELVEYARARSTRRSPPKARRKKWGRRDRPTRTRTASRRTRPKPTSERPRAGGPPSPEISTAWITGKSEAKWIVSKSGEEDRVNCSANDIDRVVAAPLGNHAIAIWRRDNAIEGRELDETGKAIGAIVKLSAPGTFSGKPAILGGATEAIVAFASRAKATDPWKLVFARWKAGTKTTIETGAAPAMAPSLVATSDPACVLFAWTDGTGKSTVAHAAHVCSDTVVAASKIDVSGAGIESGDSVLAPAPDGAYTIWQELPAKGPAELKLSHITCK